MIDLQSILAMICIALGAFFLMVGSVGIIRLPDFYTRSHAIGLSDTLGILLVLGGLIIYEGLTLNAAKLVIAIIFVVISSPTGSHAIARAAFRAGLKPRFVKKKPSGD